MGLQDAIAAEAAAIKAQNAARSGRKNILGMDVSKYVGYKRPGIDTTRIFSEPWCMLKNGEERKHEVFLWRKPEDSYTKSMCLRGTIRPVLTEELDDKSPYSNVDRARIITKQGPREVVRTPAGTGLFVVNKGHELTNQDLGLLPGDHWEDQYLSDLAEQEDSFAQGLEEISASSLQGRVSGKITSTDTQREIIG